MVARGCMALSVVVALVLGPAQAQVDNDPTNDTTGGADALVLVINFDDFALVANNFGRTGTGWKEGNFNLDDVTNFEDFAELSTSFGMTFPSGGKQPTPEPTILTLLSFALGCQSMRPRWKLLAR